MGRRVGRPLLGGGGVNAPIGPRDVKHLSACVGRAPHIAAARGPDGGSRVLRAIEIV